MTRSAEDERLSLERDHSLDPFWLWPSWVLMEVLHPSYVMYFDIFGASAEFAGLCQEPLDEF